MKLTIEQSEQIRFFIQQRGFKYIDVQMEILDHVVSSVEEKMTTNPELKFADAVNQTQASFGVKGFSIIEDSIVKGLNRKYNRLFFKNFLYYFGYKYILSVLFSGIFLYKLQEIISNKDNFFTVFLAVLMGLTLVLLIFRFKSDGFKEYMSYKISGSYLGYMAAFLTFSNTLITKNFSQNLMLGLNVNHLIISICITLFFVYAAAALKTARVGAKDSKLLAEKLQLLCN
jgi:hypothetical protein